MSRARHFYKPKVQAQANNAEAWWFSFVSDFLQLGEEIQGTTKRLEGVAAHAITFQDGPQNDLAFIEQALLEWVYSSLRNCFLGAYLARALRTGVIAREFSHVARSKPAMDILLKDLGRLLVEASRTRDAKKGVKAAMQEATP